MGRTAGLDGAVVGITAERKGTEQARMVSDLGGVPVVGATMHTVPLGSDPELAAALADVVSHPPSVIASITGVGTRGLFRSAEELGMRADLERVFAGARRYARGPKARTALRELGLGVEWTPPSETSSELLARLVAEAQPGQRVMVQAHGQPMPEFRTTLSPLGVDVVEVPVYRWHPPLDPEPGRELVRRLVAGELDAVSFTSAPSVRGLFSLAEPLGMADPAKDALRRSVVAAVGDVTADELRDAGVEPDLIPSRPRMGIMYRELADNWGELGQGRERRS
ncbi:MAG: uroporphyrinogen-III synthase [Actinobacteria bacterium ATB1]|nr:uroporphyrinogen-III synthase [Actinobacteria bacterium ATB1]